MTRNAFLELLKLILNKFNFVTLVSSQDGMQFIARENFRMAETTSA